jgi:hypothetical protein
MHVRCVQVTSPVIQLSRRSSQGNAGRSSRADAGRPLELVGWLPVVTGRSSGRCLCGAGVRVAARHEATRHVHGVVERAAFALLAARNERVDKRRRRGYMALGTWDVMAAAAVWRTKADGGRRRKRRA